MVEWSVAQEAQRLGLLPDDVSGMHQVRRAVESTLG